MSEAEIIVDEKQKLDVILFFPFPVFLNPNCTSDSRETFKQTGAGVLPQTSLSSEGGVQDGHFKNVSSWVPTSASYILI